MRDGDQQPLLLCGRKEPLDELMAALGGEAGAGPDRAAQLFAVRRLRREDASAAVAGIGGGLRRHHPVGSGRRHPRRPRGDRPGGDPQAGAAGGARPAQPRASPRPAAFAGCSRPRSCPTGAAGSRSERVLEELAERAGGSGAVAGVAAAGPAPARDRERDRDGGAPKRQGGADDLHPRRRPAGADGGADADGAGDRRRPRPEDVDRPRGRAAVGAGCRLRLPDDRPPGCWT